MSFLLTGCRLAPIEKLLTFPDKNLVPIKLSQLSKIYTINLLFILVKLY